MPTWMAAEKLLKDSRAVAVLRQIAKHENKNAALALLRGEFAHYPELAKKYAEPEIAAIMAHPDAPIVAVDRVVNDIARQQGYDAIVAYDAFEGREGEVVMLDPAHALSETGPLSPELEARLAALQKANRGAFSTAETAYQDLPPKPRYTFKPANQAAIDAATKLNEAYHAVQLEVELAVPKRQHYMPWVHEGTPEALANRAARTKSPTEFFDPRTIQRDQVQVTKPEQLRAGFTAMNQNLGRQVQQRVIVEHLGALLDDPQIKELFSKTFKATGDKRTPTQAQIEAIQDRWLKIIGYPRAATVSLTPRHGANILDLAANTVPLAEQPAYFARVMSLAKKIATAKSVKEYAALTKEGRALGAVGGNFRERQAFFQRFPDWAGPLAGKKTPLAPWTETMNRITWAVDEAAKIEYAKLLVARGEAQGLEAGGLAAKRLVDYEHTSPFVQHVLRYVAPFGTFRGSIPGAIVGGIARSPARAAFLNRATGGTMYGGQPEPFQHGYEAYLPTADVSRGLDFLTPWQQRAAEWDGTRAPGARTETGPTAYMRSTLAAPIRAAGTLAGEAFSNEPGASLEDAYQEALALPAQVRARDWASMGVAQKRAYADAAALKNARFLTYHKPVDLRFLLDYAAMGVPEANTALSHLGLGQFKPKDLPGEVLQQTLGVSAK